MLARVSRCKIRDGPAAADAEPREIPLHDKILKWCANQWPRWKVIRARPDKPSGIQVGAQDLTVFSPGGRVFCVELKSRDGKLSKQQAAWAVEMDMLGHRVHVVRSLREFLAIVGAA